MKMRPSSSSVPTLENAQAVLREVWGYDAFRPLQADSIESVLQQKDSLTVLPTGGGKSICFQAPALCVDGMAVVVSPLISLMKDQVDALVSNGVSSAFINSTLSLSEKRDIAEQIDRGEIKLLYVAPEGLLSDRMLDYLKKSNVSFFAIDEAHCISAWGHDFRPEYRGLRILKHEFPHASVHAFTATASGPVRDDIVSQLGLADAKVMVGDFDRPNLTYRMIRANKRLQQVADIVEKHRGESGIVYCISRKEVERTALALEQMNCTALAYHAGMSDRDRKANQDAFIKEKCDVIVATVAFGMGIDKSNVRYVIHSGMPKSIEHYQQESGRAGRDSLESECVLIYSGGDVVTWKRIMEGGDNAHDNSGALRSLEAMNALCTSPVCRHKAIVEYFGQTYTSDNCGACDVCLEEVELVEDPITLSQKILSGVIRTQERFGIAHNAKVLAGSNEKRIRDLGHDQLSTFGLLADEGVAAARLWIDQLIQQGYLLQTGEYQTISLSESGRRLIRRDGNPKLTVPGVSKSSPRRSVSVDSWDGVDRGLFAALRELRSRLASERNVPAYIIFGDATLREFARCRPDSIERVALIKGVGEKKLEDFGLAFLEAINDYCTTANLQRNVSTVVKVEPVQKREVIRPNAFASFEHFRAGASIEEVAEKMGRAKSTVTGYLQSFLQNEKITDSSAWVDEQTKTKILSHLHLLEEGKMKPMYEFFNGEISYESIRIVLTCKRNAES
ncbi:ATP-dependent DNA helicase RecQ [Novipirellula aureliae]|uniref:DNA helicase RecQ n=1 Tax=Novipirellula aureliae TaxID=2527966 RepID=A0A5C6DZ40_9BACT|nr:DNA helicase RecQ [Novipirellula aureliae]TWU40336.1 ATP-dependent DNA helicase RecQ [Novipirellula aureliae]